MADFDPFVQASEGEASGPSSGSVVPDASGPDVSPAPSPKDREAYIDRMGREAETYARSILPPQVKTDRDGYRDMNAGEFRGWVDGRVQRARTYAAWRWDGFHAGEIQSL